MRAHPRHGRHRGALVEQVQAGVDVEAAQKLAAKVKSGDGFDLNDFLAQLRQMKRWAGCRR